MLASLGNSLPDFLERGIFPGGRMASRILVEDIRSGVGVRCGDD